MLAQSRRGVTPPHVQIAVVLLCASAAIHTWLIGAHGSDLLHGAVFATSAGFLIVAAASLWRHRSPRAAALSFSLAGGLVALYALTRVTTLPLAGAPEEVDAIGLFTKGLEISAMALLAPLAVRCDAVQAALRPTPLRRAGLAGALGAGLFALVGVPASNAVTGSVCPLTARTLTYNVVAMNVDIVFNNDGDHNPNGAMYAMASDEDAIRRQVKANPNRVSELVRPLVIRANRGDCVVVDLTNKLNRRAGFHVQGVAYDVGGNDGSKVGDNPDSTVAPPDGTRTYTRTYTYYVPSDEEEGAHMIEDLGDPRGGENLHDTPDADEDGAKGSVGRGLYGSLNVEPANSTWTDPETGDSLAGKAAPDADIHILGTGNDFREGTLIGWDETDVLDKNGMKPKDHNGGETSFFGFNYRTEPLRNRRKNNVPEMTSQGGDQGDGEELAYSSWAHGDPTTPILHGYKGDPVKLRILMAGAKETHVFHLHEHRWRNEAKDPTSTRIDSQSWGAGQSFNLDLEGGMGSQTGSVGDSIFHCHLYPHFISGMWGMLRSLDRLEDGTRHYPDGTQTPKLVALPDREAPPAPTKEQPGYPHFMPGAVADSVAAEYPDGRTGRGFGHRPPQSPLSVFDAAGNNDRRGPFDTSWRTTGSADKIDALTPTEKSHFPDSAEKPGAPYVDPCPAGAPVRKYELSLIQRRIDYNNNGWHDPEGRMFVLKRDEADVLAGTKEPEPLVIRANEGDCVDFSFTNKAPLRIGGNKFQSLLLTNEAGMHVHLVKFDVLASDGATNGWNYDQAALRNQTMRYRWMVDTDLKSIFWHDHSFAGVHQQHGVFAGMVAEPKGSTHRNPKNGKAVGPADLAADQQLSGWRMDILDPNGPDFREFAIFAQDFVPLFDKNNQEINPPALPDDLEDQGVSGISYRNAPFKFRRSKTLADGKKQAVDPAYVYSSTVHGDPETAIMEAYRRDPVKIRLFQGSQEEQHTFSMHAARWRFEPDDPDSELRSTQAFGISEAFNFYAPTFENCGSTACKGDYLYSLNNKDSLWLGAWGIFRAHKFKQDGKNGRGPLLELPDAPNKPPEDSNNVDNTSQSTCGDGINLLGITVSTKCLLDPITGTTTPPNPGSCTTGAPVPKFSVVAFNVPLTYNSKGDKEDFGLVYALAADESAIKAGTKKAEPLMIRVNKGDCAEVTLTNKLPKTIPPREGDDPKFEAEDGVGWGPSNRVSIHASGLLKYEVNGSDGATVGYNSDQTIGPGESITQRWYADEEVGAVLLEDKADQLNHRFRGLFGGLVVEPAGSTWTSQNGGTLNSGTQAIVTTGTGEKFREFGMFLQDGLNTVNSAGQHPIAKAEEPEDGGDLGYNYRSAPFSRRLSNPGSPSADELTNVFSSQAGPIDTPLLEAKPGDPIRIRLYGSNDQRRQQAFEVTGHAWPQEPGDPNTVWRNSQDAIGPGVQDNLHIKAGGAAGRVGDYRYGSTIQRRHREGGLWGLVRVLSSTSTKIKSIK